MADIIAGMITLLIFFLPSMLKDYEFSNRLSPNGYQTDWEAMNCDLAMGKSKNEVMSKANRGGYDIKKK